MCYMLYNPEVTHCFRKLRSAKPTFKIVQDKILEIACCILYRLKGSEKEGFQRKVIRANDTFSVEGRQGQWPLFGE